MELNMADFFIILVSVLTATRVTCELVPEVVVATMIGRVFVFGCFLKKIIPGCSWMRDLYNNRLSRVHSSPPQYPTTAALLYN